MGIFLTFNLLLSRRVVFWHRALLCSAFPWHHASNLNTKDTLLGALLESHGTVSSSLVSFSPFLRFKITSDHLRERRLRIQAPSSHF